MFPGCLFHFCCSHNGTTHSFNLLLPLYNNRFLESAEMNGEQFFSRWKALNL